MESQGYIDGFCIFRDMGLDGVTVVVHVERQHICLRPEDGEITSKRLNESRQK